jgi:uncharacterized protein YdaU (DUF1376 family)
MNSPAFQFYVQDFLTGTMHLSAEEIGAYILLLCHQWDKGALPDSDKDLLRIGRTRMKVLVVVKQKFPVCDDGLLRNTRMENERTKQIAYRDQRRENANKRWKPKQEKTDAGIAPETIQNDNIKSPRSGITKKTRIGHRLYDKPPSILMMELFEQGITELMMGQYRTLLLPDVMAEIELQCPSGTIFTNEQHMLNKFKSVATKMSHPKKEKPDRTRTHDYSQYKRTG